MQNSAVQSLIHQGSIYRTLREYQKAFECILKAINMNIHYPPSYFELALLYSDVKQPKQVYKVCHIALQLCKNQYWSSILLGFLCENVSDWTGAKRMYKQALRATDTTDDYYMTTFNIACMYTYTPNYYKAKEWFRKALSIQKSTINSDHAKGLCINNMGMCFGFLDDTDTAHQYYCDAITICPHLLRSYQQRISTGIDLDKIDEVLQDCDTAQKLTTHKPTLAEISLSRALCRETVPEMIHDVEKALQCCPTFSNGYDALIGLHLIDGRDDVLVYINKGLEKCCDDSQAMTSLFARLSQVEKDPLQSAHYDAIADAFENGLLERIS
jgi:tetratricopeptide (TPR) repeat protein